MSIRSSTLYVQGKTIKRLLVLAKLYPEFTYDAVGGGSPQREKTADERADQIINEAIKERYPQVIELEKELAKTEKDFFEKVIQERNQQ
jgi:hypothetical protein